jgi:hypothetical protein
MTIITNYSKKQYRILKFCSKQQRIRGLKHILFLIIWPHLKGGSVYFLTNSSLFYGGAGDIPELQILSRVMTLFNG